MGTFCTSGQALLKAGRYVHENFYSGQILMPGAPATPVEEFIAQAEAVINVSSRENFVTNFLTLTTEKKLILEEVASNLAAIYMIQYDMSGYSSRVEAEDMINVLRDAALRGLSILRDKKAQDFVNKA